MKQRRLEPNKDSIKYILVKPKMFGYLILGWALFWIVVVLFGIYLGMTPTLPGG